MESTNFYLDRLFNDSNNVYLKLQDELSRKIYCNRILNNMTYDYSYLVNIMPQKSELMEWLRPQLSTFAAEGRKLVLDGAGYYGRSIRATLKEFEFECFCDRALAGKNIMGLSVLTRADAVDKYSNACFIVTSMVYGREIKKELQQLGITCIIDAGNYINKNGIDYDYQYYDVFEFAEDEIVADIGCFDCQSIFRYLKYANKKYKKIYSFEPEPAQYDNCKSIISGSGYADWEIYPYGAWSENKNLYMNSYASCSNVVEHGNIAVKLVKLDDFFEKREAPTFIKMDIEGAELEALKGLSETIKKNKPKLAICVYHKLEDIFEIPQYILELNPDYKLYLRHYTNRVNETVLYAV